MKPRHTGISSAVALSHLFLRSCLREGDRVVDATCGNGHDTLFLAELVGPAGKVFGFDIQRDALDAADRRLADAGVRERVELIGAGHERMVEHVQDPVRAVVFNLGYLPGGDKEVITKPETTVRALGQALRLLAPGGLLVVVVYPGHPGGREEGGAVEQWAATLPTAAITVWKSFIANAPENASYMVAVEKKRELP